MLRWHANHILRWIAWIQEIIGVACINDVVIGEIVITPIEWEI